MWERDAQYECASIPAFLQLAADLLAHDAPASLIDGALDAARDEMVHAVVCANLASRYLGERVWPVVPDAEVRRPLAGTPGLARLAVESWLDGCRGEGAAAARALCGAERAVNPVAGTACHVIAADELRHAELGWSVLAWALERGGDDVRDVVWQLRNAKIAAAVDAEDDLENYGCLRARDIDDIGEATVVAARQRLDALLGTADRARASTR